MSFVTQLPNELISLVICHTIPESFEGIALSCKWVHNLCIPFIAEYKRLSRALKSFEYRKYDTASLGKHAIKSAFELILEIAKNPVIARYIEVAAFSKDCFFVELGDIITPDEREGELILQLLAGSDYLKQAGIDPEEFFFSIQESVLDSGDDSADWHWYIEQLRFSVYSQDAAAFLLTLLPNLKSLKLPSGWTPTRESDNLIEAIVARSKTAQNCLVTTSLGQTQAITSGIDYEDQPDQPDQLGIHLKKVDNLLALPNVSSFVATGYCIRGANSMSFALYSNLTSIQFVNCYLNHEAISRLLQHTPSITLLKYFHSARGEMDSI